jgi:uncharacterized protein
MDFKEKIETYSKNKTGSEISAGFDHFKRVYANARKIAIASRTNYDDEILHASCFLHDIELEEPHARLSAKKARKFLETIEFPKEKIESVVDAIKGHIPTMRPESMEAKLLHDADLMDFLGATGVLRLSAASATWLNKGTLREAIDVIKKYRDLAFKNLIFQESKGMAEEKLKFMESVISQAEKEIE